VAGKEGPRVPSIELVRKVMAFAVDMVEEYAYIQQQIANPANIDLPKQPEGADSGAAALDLMTQLHALRPLGIEFCATPWAEAAVRVLRAVAEVLGNGAAADSVTAVAKGGLLGALKERLGMAAEGPVASTGHSVVVLRAVAENTLGLLQQLLQSCRASCVPADSGNLEPSLEGLVAWSSAVDELAGEVGPRARAVLALLRA
jgi:hypothetical protein